jgi:hypothetical protein
MAPVARTSSFNRRRYAQFTAGFKKRRCIFAPAFFVKIDRQKPETSRFRPGATDKYRLLAFEMLPKNFIRQG